MKRVKEGKEILRGVVQNFDNNERKGEIRYGETVYKIARLDIKQEACMLPENETVTFELQHSDKGDKAVNVRTAAPRKRGKVFYMGADSGKIRVPNGNMYVFSFDDIEVQHRKLKMDDMVEFTCTRNDEDRVAIKIICDNDYALHKFCGKLSEKVYAQLAALAADENWKLLNMDHTSAYPILKSYLLHTFEKAIAQDLIAYSLHQENKKVRAYFNTGLLTNAGDEIYAVFSKSTSEENYRNPTGWSWSNFTDRDTSILISCDRTPLAPRYYYTSGEITFNTDAEITVLDQRIAKQCLHLLPPSFLSGDLEFLRSAVKEAVEVSWNKFKKETLKAVPKSYNNHIEFALPFYLNGEIKLAMTLHWKEDRYLVKSLVPLDNAYKCARMLGSVTETWLKPICFYEKVDWA